MKKIGQGWQYTVYDIGNGRVLKKHNRLLVSFFVIIKDFFYFRDFRFWMIPKYVSSVKHNSEMSFRLLDRLKLNPEWFGNVEWLSNLDYKQDKVVTIGDYLKGNTIFQSRRIIDKFVLFNKQLLKYNIADKSFNICNNFGINKKGEIVLVDLGELSSGVKIKKHIKNKIWKERYIVGLLPKNLQEYFIKKMNKEIKIVPKKKRKKNL